MDTQHLQSWDEFKEAIDKLEQPQKEKESSNEPALTPFLFRGQANQDWDLSTTLERYPKVANNDTISMSEYYKNIRRLQPQIESFTEKTFDTHDYPGYRQWLLKQSLPFIGPFKGYDYFIYLRHHGFPSPLLDWTASPYIAAYFAFCDKETSAERVSIFAYRERTQHGKTANAESAAITRLGPFIRSHQRHFKQHSDYTICVKRMDNDAAYISHQEVFKINSRYQDLLWKYTILEKERSRALKELDRYNLNAFSLYGSEKSLMKALAFRAFS